jgi:hypothetical protein
MRNSKASLTLCTRLSLLLLMLHAAGLSAQIADTSMPAKVLMQRKLDSIADLFPTHASYRVYSPEELSQVRIFGRIPAAVTRKTSAGLTQYTITMDTAGYGINLNTMDSAEARTAIESIELVLYQNRLIKASVFYDESKGDLWEKWYFTGNYCFLGTASPFDMLIQTNLNYHEFLPLADGLEQEAQ